MTKGIAHVALYPAKFDETVKFYEEVFDAENQGFIKNTRRGCCLKIGEDILEIFESESLGTGTFKHIAIACDNIEALLQKALDHGATLIVLPCRNDKIAYELVISCHPQVLISCHPQVLSCIQTMICYNHSEGNRL